MSSSTKLVVMRDDAVVREVLLESRDWRIGRARENDLVLDDPDKGVSRFHAELRWEQGRVVVLDLNSRNGTWIDGERVRRALLEAGSEVLIGPYRLRLVETAARPAAAASASAPAVPVSRTTRPSPPPVPPHRPETQRLVRSGAPAAAAPPAFRRPAAPVQPGLLAALARLPKPVIFGGFAVIVVFVLVLGQLFAPAPGNQAPATEAQPAAPQEPAAAAPTNDDMIAKHLEAARALVDSGEPERALRDHIERILLIDRSHVEALELKARAEDAARNQSAGTAPAPDPR
jgi:predicted component of type VI protein secretion system